MFQVGRFTVLRTFRKRVGRRRPWFVRVKDESGKIQVMRAYLLVRQEITGLAKATLRRTHPRLYATFQQIRARCYHWWHKDYRWYGRRGIRLSRQWLRSFDAFARYVIALGYSPGSGLSLDRIDNDGDYKIGNLRMATPKEQARNRRSSKAA